MERPEYLKSGEIARLFPVIAETGKEQRASSIFLSILSAVPPLADALLAQLGQTIGTRTIINTYTEIAFKTGNDPVKRDRPDGLICVNTGRREWTCLIEAKIGKNNLQVEQVEKYLKLARENNINAVLTISNEFATLPTHHPLKVQRNLIKRVEFLHLSWSAILTEAILLHEQAEIKDAEQAFLLREFVRFFSHDSAGVVGFTSMPREWSTVIDRIQAGGQITSPDGAKIVDAWHQEIRDLSLIMSQIISCRIATKLSRIHINDPARLKADDIDTLCQKGCLATELEVPNAASTINIFADLNARSLRVSMQIKAPRDKARNLSRTKWLLRQLKDLDLEDVYVSAIWTSRAPKTVLTLKEVREYPENLESGSKDPEIRAFEVTLKSSSARRFSGLRTFIEELELIAPLFYEKIGQHLSTWQAPPPKPKHTIREKQVEVEQEKSDMLEAETMRAGNAHSDLLEIPSFLNRVWK